IAAVARGKYQHGPIRAGTAQRHITMTAKGNSARQVIRACIEVNDAVVAGCDRSVDLSVCRPRIEGGADRGAIRNAAGDASLAPVYGATGIKNTRPELCMGRRRKAKHEEGTQKQHPVEWAGKRATIHAPRLLRACKRHWGGW